MSSSATEDALKTFRIVEFENIASYFPSKINCNTDPLSGKMKKLKKNNVNLETIPSYKTYSNHNIHLSPSK